MVYKISLTCIFEGVKLLMAGMFITDKEHEGTLANDTSH